MSRIFISTAIAALFLLTTVSYQPTVKAECVNVQAVSESAFSDLVNYANETFKIAFSTDTEPLSVHLDSIIQKAKAIGSITDPKIKKILDLLEKVKNINSVAGFMKFYTLNSGSIPGGISFRKACTANGGVLQVKRNLETKF